MVCHFPLLVAAGGTLRMVVGGRYGLGSKDFTPAMAKAVFDNLKADKPRDRFTVGITGAGITCVVGRRAARSHPLVLLLLHFLGVQL
jgi:hypothetical protein